MLHVPGRCHAKTGSTRPHYKQAASRATGQRSPGSQMAGWSLNSRVVTREG